MPAGAIGICVSPEECLRGEIFEFSCAVQLEKEWLILNHLISDVKNVGLGRIFVLFILFIFFPYFKVLDKATILLCLVADG